MTKTLHRLLAVILTLSMVLLLLPTDAMALAGNIGSTLPRDYNTPNTARWSVNTIDGGTVNYQTYSGKTQILILFRTNGKCFNSNATIKGIAASDWVSDDSIQVIAIGVGEPGESEQTVLEHVISYKAEYAPNCNDIVFGYATSNQFWSIVGRFKDLMGTEEESGVTTYAVNYIIDSSDNFRFTWQGSFNQKYYSGILSLLDGKNDGTFGTYKLGISGTNDYDSAYEVLDILNGYRRQNGLPALKMDGELLETAMFRAAETAIYYSHTRPDATDFSTALSNRFSQCVNAENIAAGHSSAQEVMTSWENSPGHNANMLDAGHDSVGIGCFIDSNGNRYWVQCFSSATGIAEGSKSSGSKKVTHEINVFAGVLDARISSTSAILNKGGNTIITLTNQNLGFERSCPEVFATYAASDDPNIATASIGADGRVIVSAVNEGIAMVKIGFAHVGADFPTFFYVAVTVRSSTPTHDHDGFIAWSDSSKMPTEAGSYYLTTDVFCYASSGKAEYGGWSTPPGEIDLCLNGHTISYGFVYSGCVIEVNSDSVLNIYNCSDDNIGAIKTSKDASGITNKGTLNIYGGTIESSGYKGITNYGTVTVNGGAVNGSLSGIDNSGTVTINRGVVRAAGYGINNNGTLTVNGGAVNSDYIGIWNLDTMTIEGGSVSGNFSGIDCSSSELTVNGGSIRGDRDGGITTKYSTVTVNDGTITGNSGVHIYSGSVNIYDGTVDGDEHGILADESGQACIYGGTVKGGVNGICGNGYNVNIYSGFISGEDAGVYVYDKDLDLSGDAEISGGSSDIVLEKGTYIRIVEQLKNAEPYTVSVRDGENIVIGDIVFTNSSSYYQRFNDPACFAPAVELARLGYIVIKNDDQQLQFVIDDGTHGNNTTHDDHDGIVFAKWDKVDALPDTAGNYYLTKDVVLEETWETPSGEINVCFNGHTISCDNIRGATIDVNAGSTLNIYDCSEEKSGAIKDSTFYGITSYGTLTVNGGTISGFYGIFCHEGSATINGGTVTGRYGIVNTGTLTVNGGRVSGESTGINNGADSTVTVNGGTIEGTGDSGDGIYNNSGTLTVNDGNISGNKYGISNSYGTVTVNGGIITGGAEGIYNYHGNVTVNKGVINGEEVGTDDDDKPGDDDKPDIGEDKPFIFGDLNGDGTVNITDAIELLKYVAKLDNNVVNIAGTDIDGNGTVNINDAIYLLKKIAGLI